MHGQSRVDAMPLHLPCPRRPTVHTKWCPRASARLMKASIQRTTRPAGLAKDSKRCFAALRFLILEITPGRRMPLANGHATPHQPQSRRRA